MGCVSGEGGCVSGEDVRVDTNFGKMGMYM